MEMPASFRKAKFESKTRGFCTIERKSTIPVCPLVLLSTGLHFAAPFLQCVKCMPFQDPVAYIITAFELTRVTPRVPTADNPTLPLPPAPTHYASIQQKLLQQRISVIPILRYKYWAIGSHHPRDILLTRNISRSASSHAHYKTAYAPYPPLTLDCE